LIATLLSMPDSKWPKLKEVLEVGTSYKILNTIGNGFVIQPKGCEDQLLILQSRFEVHNG